MSTREQFVQLALAEGLAENDIAVAMSQYRKRFGLFDDEQQQQVAPELKDGPVPDFGKMVEDPSMRFPVAPSEKAIQAIAQTAEPAQQLFEKPAEAVAGLGKGFAVAAQKISAPIQRLGHLIVGKVAGPQAAKRTKQMVEEGHQIDIMPGVEQRFAKIGEEATKIGVGALSAAAVPGVGVASPFIRGAVATYPEVAEDVAKGNAKRVGAKVLAGGVIGGGFEYLPTVLKKAGAKIARSSIKPLKVFRKQGFDPEMIGKHRLGGTMSQVATNTNNKIRQLSKELKKELVKNPKAKVNLTSVLDDVDNQIARNPSKYGADITEMRNAVNRYKKDLETLASVGVNTKNADLLVVNGIRRGVGRHGSFNVLQKTPEITARQKVANMYYKGLRQAIDNVVPDKSKLQTINRTLHELIPVEGAVNHAIERTGNNFSLSLPDWFILGGGALGLGIGDNDATTGVGTLALLAARRGLSSTLTGSALMGLERRLATPLAQNVLRGTIPPTVGLLDSLIEESESR